MQANGAEMLRLAICLATERGVEVCAPIHDAVLICSRLDRLEQDVAITQAAFAEASRVVLGGFELRSEAKIVRFPDRYFDARGRRMWEETMSLVEKAEAAKREAVRA
jgi:DNA polymerase-1